MKDILDALKGMETSTLIILGFAAVLLIFLLVLIIVTIKVLRSSNYEEDEEEAKKAKDEKLKKIAEEMKDNLDDDLDDDEDDMSRTVREVVESVKETQAKVEAQKTVDEKKSDDEIKEEKSEDDIARKNAAARVQKIAAAVAAGESDEDEDDDYDDYDESESDEDSVVAPDAPDITSSAESDDYEDDYDDDYDEDDPDIGNITDELEIKKPSNKEMTPEVAAAKTAVVDTVKIKEELRKARKEAKEAKHNMAKERAEAPEYDASFDSAFVDKPAYEEKKEPLIPNPTPESVLAGEGAATAAATSAAFSVTEMAESGAEKAVQNKITVNPVNVIETTPKENIEQVKEFLEENPTPAPVSKKKKSKKKKGEYERSVAPIKTSKYFWYNTQDIEGLTRKEDMYFKCHYFDNGDDIVLDLITEMYDCAFVRTEELQRIAYGITFKSLGMKEILRSEENLGFDHDKATKEPSESDRQEAFDKWCQYVDNFLEIIEINAPQEVKDYIIEKMYDYGHKDIEELMYSPY